MKKVVFVLVFVLVLSGLAFSQTVFNSDGTTSTRIGNNTFHSDGTTSTRIGNNIFHSDGSTSTIIGK